MIVPKKIYCESQKVDFLQYSNTTTTVTLSSAPECIAAFMSASAHRLARVLLPACVARALPQQLNTSCTALALSITSHKPSEARMKKSSAGVTHTLLTSGMAMTACVGVLREKSPRERDTASRTVESGQFTRQQPEKITELVCVCARVCCLNRDYSLVVRNDGSTLSRHPQAPVHQHIRPPTRSNTLSHNPAIMFRSNSLISCATN